ncbi:MAG TPA: vanadium-dependent haloperoxidase [Candidatus Limnocylindrales bacterium]|nr:vanadium-dependent haloperoxidase [Candidatus Limnocylindrales bacterium]
MAGAVAASGVMPAAAAGPNIVSQWNVIAENTVVGAGAQQIEGYQYLAYVQLAVYDAVVAIEGGYRPYGPAIDAPDGASADAAVVQAAYETLVHYFPSSAATLLAARTASLDAIPDGAAESDGIAVGSDAAQGIIAVRDGDGLRTPIATTSEWTPKAPAPGVWRLTPGAFAPAHTPWVAEMTPFVLKQADQFLPPPPPSLKSKQWEADRAEIFALGRNTSAVRTPEQTATAVFYSANADRQYNRLGRDVAAERSLSVLETARLLAMIDTVAADAGIAVLYAKYHYQFWRPVTAIDPTAIKPGGDGLGPVPGFDDGNPATQEEVGWRPLLTTPNHPEYPAAHGTVTSAMVEVMTTFLGTNAVDIDVHGFDASGAAGNLNAVHHFDRANDWRAEIINARLWAGLHYRTSSEAGVAMGRSVAKYDLRNAFQPVR